MTRGSLSRPTVPAVRATRRRSMNICSVSMERSIPRADGLVSDLIHRFDETVSPLYAAAWAEAGITVGRRWPERPRRAVAATLRAFATGVFSSAS